MKKPLLIVLVGLPGSGKTEYAKRLAYEYDALRISSDDMRDILYGDEMDQSHNSELFDVIHQSIKTSLLCRENVIFDATNLSAKRRKALNNYLAKVNCRKECHVVAKPYEDCLKMNKERDRQVPEEVIFGMYKKFTFPHANLEGYDEVKIYYPNPEDMYKYGRPMSFLAKYMDFNQCNSHHKETLGMHSLNTFYYCTNHHADVVTMQAAALHDNGKPMCMEFVDKNGNPCKDARFYGHANVGAYNSLFYDVIDRFNVPVLINYHMLPYQFADNENLKKKYEDGFGKELFNKLMIVHKADIYRKGEQ